MFSSETAIILIGAEDPEKGFGWASTISCSVAGHTWSLVAGSHQEQFFGCLYAARERLESLTRIHC